MVSHVCGNAEWRPTDALDVETILATKEKAAYIESGLRDIVGEEYFRVDVLRVNQADKDARVAVTEHIPAIFRNGQRTIVVMDGYGIPKCCLDSIMFD